MNKSTTRKMRTAHEKQAKSIRETAQYAKIKKGFDIEYQVACEIEKARVNTGMTQSELAKVMGTTQSVISRIERGANVSIATLDRYVTACGHHLQISVV